MKLLDRQRTIEVSHPNWYQVQFVRVSAIADLLEEGIHKTTLVHTSVSLDDDYSTTKFEPGNVATVSITDNDVLFVQLSTSNVRLEVEDLTQFKLLLLSNGVSKALCELLLSELEPESGVVGLGAYEIRLGAQPEADVVVKLSSLDQKVIPILSLVRFNVDWSEPKTVYIVSNVEFDFGDVDLMGYEGILHHG
jgi:hypothetical protein